MYNLVKKNIKNQSKESFILEFKMKDFCCVGDDLYFIYNGGIGVIIDGDINLNWHHELSYTIAPDFSTPSSMCYNTHNNCIYIVSAGGSQIHKINLILMNFECIVSLDNFNSKFFNNLNSNTYIAANANDIIFSVKNCHRCFTLKSGDVVPLIGSGKSGFSISSLKNSRISSPTGVTIMEKTFCFSDSGNNCLRGVSGNSSFIIISDCKDLKDIHYINHKLFFLSDNNVHMLSSEGDATHLFEVYKGKNKILSFCPTDKGCVYILEESYATTFKETENH